MALFFRLIITVNQGPAPVPGTAGNVPGIVGPVKRCRNWVTASRVMVPGSWSLGHGPRFVVPGYWRPVPGPQSPGQTDISSRVMVPGPGPSLRGPAISGQDPRTSHQKKIFKA